ncbi:301_t:CDS:10 [Funneliformis mosseae]|uniref:301_t:CDS:1 n=1 Tax=Funneliformis mosseae TaxID=27381 RepID=A0A9N8VM06_FUNMO|nr:301_t:CDS:10 [Funneliformis mosseae]
MTSAIDYRNKIILAPMVRVGTLPLRLLALEFGADLVYSPEMVDKRIIASERHFDEETRLIAYVDDKKTINFRSHPIEKSKLIFQIGTSDPELALQAALKVKQDVSGIDVNCGCPKKFSIQGGMGVALLSNPDKLKSILTNLVQNSGLPITCKIRMLQTKEQTLELCKMIESTGVKAITIHCRTKDERPRQPGHWDIFKYIADNITSIPIIANGDIFQRSDIVKLKEISNVSSFMIARAAQSNVSIFREEGTLLLKDVVTRYIKKAIDVGNNWPNTKYTLVQMYAECAKEPEYRYLTQSKSYEDVCKIYGLESYLQNANATNGSFINALFGQPKIKCKKLKRNQDEIDFDSSDKKKRKVEI